MPKTRSFAPRVSVQRVLIQNKFCAQCNNQIDYNLFGIEMTCNTTKDEFMRQNISFATENCTIRTDKNAQKLLWKSRIFFCTYATNYAREYNPSSPHYKLCNAYLAYSDDFANPHYLKCANFSAKIGNLEE